MKWLYQLGIATVLGIVMSQEAQAANPVVIIETSMGTIKAELFEEKAPITVKNFLDYVSKKQFDDTVFHRVIEGFMIQGGGYTADQGEKKTVNAPIKNEGGNGLKNVKGTLAMARTGDPDSATAQFFINVADNGFLDRAQARDGFGYAVFGRVIDGMDVVDKIKAVKTGKKGMFATDAPLEDIVIKSIRKAE